MTIFPFKYGNSTLDVYVPENLKSHIIHPKQIPMLQDQHVCVLQSIQNPISELHLPFLNSVSMVAIAINDKSRPVPHHFLLPPLLQFFENYGIKKEQITFFIATGTHSPMTSTEFDRILPEEIITNYQVVSHNCDDLSNLTYIGTTLAGTNVLVNSKFYQSSIKVVIGNIEPHHFMGFSGGNKTASIGLTGRETINHNHSFLVSDKAITGEFDNNPCRLDVEEIGEMIKVDLALNAILSPDKTIVHSLFGSPQEVIHAGIPLSRDICQVPVDKKYDLVIASAGGYPKDINLYQAQKAYTNAASITNDGGCIVLIAECIEGAGSNPYLSFMQDVSTPDEALEKFSKIEFQIGPHKAFQLARQAKRIHLYLLSSMSTDLVTSLFLTSVNMAGLQLMIEKAEHDSSTVALMPNAVTTIPLLSE